MLISRVIYLIVSLSLIGCTSTDYPHDFLRAEPEAWSKWMDEVVDVHLEAVPIQDLTNTPPFERTNLVSRGVEPSLRMTLHAERITRREALWRIAQKYGLRMSAGFRDGIPSYVVITKR